MPPRIAAAGRRRSPIPTSEAAPPSLRHAARNRWRQARQMEHPLDNPVWYALTGPHAGLALGHGVARHYPRDMAPFSALAAALPAAYADLAVDLPLGLEARLFRPAEEKPPPGWEVVSVRPIVQMVANAVDNPASVDFDDARMISLGPAATTDMLSLA